MKILLTGGAGDLGSKLTEVLTSLDYEVHRVDINTPNDNLGIFHQTSILDREKLTPLFKNMDTIVHIAAWHGIHEFRNEYDAYQFWDLNVTGTMNVLESAYQTGVKNIINISSSSVEEENSFYGKTKLLSEELCDFYFDTRNLNIISLRPRAFIPFTNTYAYKSFIEWAEWFWKGAVHIDDVSQAVAQSIYLLSSKKMEKHYKLMVDGAYEYKPEDIAEWDQEGPASTFNKYYAKYYDIVKNSGLDPTVAPEIKDISKTNEILGYIPKYSLKNLLEDLDNRS